MSAFTALLPLGHPTCGNVIIHSMRAKSGVNIVPGDLLKIVEVSGGTDPKDVELDKVSIADDCIYGVETLGIEGSAVPVITAGHVISTIDTTLFTRLGRTRTLMRTGYPGSRPVLSRLREVFEKDRDFQKGAVAMEEKEKILEELLEEHAEPANIEQVPIPECEACQV